MCGCGCDCIGESGYVGVIAWVSVRVFECGVGVGVSLIACVGVGVIMWKCVDVIAWVKDGSDE